MRPSKPTCCRAFQALKPGPILSEAPTIATERGVSSFCSDCTSRRLEARLPLLGEGRRALVGVGVREHHLAQPDLELHHVVPAAAQVARHRLARGADRGRRGLADALRDALALLRE